MHVHWGSNRATARRPHRSAFSLIELVLVVVIIGIIAAIAIPKISTGATGTKDAAYKRNLSVLRSAIDRYHAEHGEYPTAAPLSGNRTTVMFQLTQYTDAQGNYSPTKSTTFKFGPYLKKIPELNVSDRAGRDKINTSDASGAGWIYDPTTGDIRGNTDTATDPRGTLYSSY